MRTTPIESTSRGRKAAFRAKRGFSLVEFFVVLLIIGVLTALLLPAVRTARPAARRMQCSNNLKMIGLALINYHERYGRLPPAYTTDDQGNRLHSWRTLVLPFLEENALYEKIDLSKPWNDPTNAEVFATRMPPMFHCPGFEPSSKSSPVTKTLYQVVVDGEGGFPGADSRKLSDIKDGVANTLLAIEVPMEAAVDWMSPNDIDWTILFAVNDKSELAHQKVFLVVFADGSVSSLNASSTIAVKRSLLTIAAGDTVGDLD